MIKRVINKITSARFLIAIIITIVFAVLALKNALTDQFVSIYMLVITFYFNKQRAGKEDEK